MIRYHEIMKNLRSHSFSYLILSLMLSITMLVPAQELMHWCDMMDSDMVETHKTMSMQIDDTHSQETEHCDMQDSEASEASSFKKCDVLIDCNCAYVQSSIIEHAVLGSSTLSIQIPLTTSVLNFIEFQPPLKTTFPPPIWSFSSYSPPDLFLANESFLI